jgi:hypothetical protein
MTRRLKDMTDRMARPSLLVRRPRRWLLAMCLAACAILAPLLGASGASGRSAHRAHAASSVMTGMGDEQVQMFENPFYQRLHTRIARYIAPYDAVAHADSLARARAWIAKAEAEHVQILVAFYHSEHTPMHLPSVSAYQHYVQKFVRMFPHVRQYQSWDEANRGFVARYFASPSAELAARYYQGLIRVCHGCTAIGLDVLDAYDIGPTLTYIREFKREIGRLRTVMPRIWGLHNYSDINRLESWRTRDLVRALGGQVWLTETGGIVKFGGAFPNRHGSGLARATRVLHYMFAVAHSVHAIARLYIYDWTGGNARTRFDAGLTDNHRRPRPGYIVVCRELRASHCNIKPSGH